VTVNKIAERSRSIESAAAAGLVFAVASVASWFLLQLPPDLSAPDAEISGWYEDPGNRQAVLLGLTLAVISAMAFLWFVAVIRRRVGDREDQFFGTVFFGSGMLLTGVMLVGSAALASPAVTATLADRVPDPGATALVVAFGTALMALVLPRMQAVFVLSTSSLALRTERISRWVSYFGYAIGLVMFFMPILLEPLSLAFPIWVGVLSVALLVRRREVIPKMEPT
jgi:MFS family permease